MRQYLDLLRDILDNGNDREDRTGTGTRSVFGRQIRFDLQQGFPAMTTKKLWWKGVVEELLFFLRGETNVKSLQDRGVNTWDPWADENGELGPVYGAMWRNWPDFCRIPGGDWTLATPIDQIAVLENDLKLNPFSRRHILSAWNVAELHRMVLPPCHLLVQFYVWEKLEGLLTEERPQTRVDRSVFETTTFSSRHLSCHMYQRSADVFLGVPWNIASYALLTHMLALVCGYQPGELIISFGDVHIYNNHFDQVREQLSREPYQLPRLYVGQFGPDVAAGGRFTPTMDLFAQNYTHRDFILRDYHYHPPIAAEISV